MSLLPALRKFHSKYTAGRQYFSVLMRSIQVYAADQNDQSTFLVKRCPYLWNCTGTLKSLNWPAGVFPYKSKHRIALSDSKRFETLCKKAVYHTTYAVYNIRKLAKENESGPFHSLYYSRQSSPERSRI